MYVLVWRSGRIMKKRYKINATPLEVTRSRNLESLLSVPYS